MYLVKNQLVESRSLEAAVNDDQSLSEQCNFGTRCNQGTRQVSCIQARDRVAGGLDKETCSRVARERPMN